MRLRHWFGEVVSVSGSLATLRPDLLDPATNRVVKAETDDTFHFTLTFEGGGIATMIASFAATPARGAKVAVMGDRGTLIAEHAGPNPMADGVVIASRDGSPLQPLETPARYALPNDDRDHRLAAFRALVREFGAGIDRQRIPRAEFHRRFALPAGARRRASVVRLRTSRQARVTGSRCCPAVRR